MDMMDMMDMMEDLYDYLSAVIYDEEEAMKDSTPPFKEEPGLPLPEQKKEWNLTAGSLVIGENGGILLAKASPGGSLWFQDIADPTRKFTYKDMGNYAVLIDGCDVAQVLVSLRAIRG